MTNRMRMQLLCAASAVALAASIAADTPKLVNVWRSPEISHLNFIGKKVAALVITDDQSLEMSGEEALTRELTARTVNGVPTYRIVPREELKKAETARTWFERAGVQGVVAMRPVSRDIEKSDSPIVWSSGYYQSFWGYYGYGWTTVYIGGGGSSTTTVVVETLIYDLTRDRLVWAATSQTTNPKQLQDFIGDLVKTAVDEMKKVKLLGSS